MKTILAKCLEGGLAHTRYPPRGRLLQLLPGQFCKEPVHLSEACRVWLGIGDPPYRPPWQ